MLETNTFKEILKILNDTDYSYSIGSLDNETMHEEILSSELKRVYKFTREIFQKWFQIVDILALNMNIKI